jgi:tRNA dimethylallyltransferase
LEPGTKTLLVLLGSTASGKTDLAIRIAQGFGTEIISADSRQFYRELSIGTAKPSPEQLSAVKHHFVGHISVTEEYNISRFEAEVLFLLEELFKAHDVVVMCGGSGLYIDVVCNGLDEQPGHDPELREQLNEALKTRGIEYLREELLKLDTEYYQKVDLANPHRLIRALEVCMLTGRPFSQFRSGKKKERPFKVVKFGLDIPKVELHGRINKRTDAMMELGLVEEVKANLSNRHLNALNTVGYKEIFDFLDENCTLEEAVEKIKTNTRRYAKRQMTWFRKDKEIHWIPVDNTEWLKGFLSGI